MKWKERIRIESRKTLKGEQRLRSLSSAKNRCLSNYMSQIRYWYRFYRGEAHSFLCSYILQYFCTYNLHFRFTLFPSSPLIFISFISSFLLTVCDSLIFLSFFHFLVFLSHLADILSPSITISPAFPFLTFNLLILFAYFLPSPRFSSTLFIFLPSP